jgi:hypothetical protein
MSILPKTKVKVGDRVGEVMFQSECGDYVIKLAVGVICVIEKEELEGGQ